MGGIKDKIMSLFKVNTTKNYMKPTCVNNVHGDRKKPKKQIRRQNNSRNEDKIIRDIKKLFEQKEEEDHYKAVRVGKFWSNSYIEYESNGDRNKTLSIKEYLDEINSFMTEVAII